VQKQIPFRSTSLRTDDNQKSKEIAFCPDALAGAKQVSPLRRFAPSFEMTAFK
jgi:hypothetical protein